MKIRIGSASKLVQGHVLDVARPALEAALRRYDPQLYVKWSPKKLQGKGCWELRRKPERKSVREGRFLDTPKGRYFMPGDIFDMIDYVISVPKYHETHAENHVKDFEYLTYDMVSWLANHDLWKFGDRGSRATTEMEYLEAKYLERIEDEREKEQAYNIKQHRSEFRDYRDFINSGGNPARIVDYWK